MQVLRNVAVSFQYEACCAFERLGNYRSATLSFGFVFAILFFINPCVFAQDYEYLGTDEHVSLPEQESISPPELTPAMLDLGLTSRGIPQEKGVLREDREHLSKIKPYPRLFRLSYRNYYYNLFDYYRLVYRPFGDPIFPPVAPNNFSNVTTYEPLQGLFPAKIEKSQNLWDLRIWGGTSNNYCSNVELTTTDPIADFYTTPRLVVESQLGTSDSVYNELGYDTITAINFRYELFPEIYWIHSNFNSINQTLDVNARIGRTAAIFQPFFKFSDITGTDLLTVELANRTRRIRLSTGMLSNVKFTSNFGANQWTAYGFFLHTDSCYNNFNFFRSRQALTYRFFRNVDLLLWSEYRYTQVSAGGSGSEGLAGVGWAGEFDARWYSELRAGWGVQDLPQGQGVNGQNLGGLRFNGYTAFVWTERVRIQLNYDRDYVFSERGVKNNYVATGFRGKVELFMGGNWYLTPTFAFVISEFQDQPGDIYLQIRPEGELAYVIQENSKIFVKVGYERDITKQNYDCNTLLPLGDFQSINAIRCSIGFLWKF